jgi:hypothetical protein
MVIKLACDTFDPTFAETTSAVKIIETFVAERGKRKLGWGSDVTWKDGM